MSDKLRSCPECQRHVFEREEECPFCHTKTSTLRTVAVVAAAAISMAAAVACGDKPTPNVPDGVPSTTPTTPTAPTTPSAVPSVKRGDQAPAPVYGGPPP